VLNINNNICVGCKVFLADYSNGFIVKNNIIWETGMPFDFIEDVSVDSNYDYNLYIQPGLSADVEMYTTQYTSNPLFVDEANHDYRLKSIARGDKVDSLYIAGGPNDGSDGKDLGAYDFIRTLTTTTYADDYTIRVTPAAVKTTVIPPGYSSATNINGVYSEWGSLEEGEHLRRTFAIGISNESTNGNTYRIIQDLQYLLSKVGNIYKFGYSSDGTNWTPQRSGTGTVSGSTIAVTHNGEEWGVNRWAGYWVKVDGTYYRITGSTAKTASGTCTLTVDGAPTTGSQTWSIDYILVKMAKRSGLTCGAAFYQGADDYDATNPITTTYTLELMEVDSES
jgi:hypothetical protein